MSANPTKKQKKATAFKNKKSKGRDEPQDVPLLDDPEADDGFGVLEDHLPRSSSMNEGKGSDKTSKKRKREDDAVIEEGPSPQKRQKATENAANEGEKPKETKQHAPAKYILFVGNLSYKTSVEAIAEHFSSCDPPPTIRRLTSRTKSGNTGREKSKGCAFLEFSKASGLQTALRLHHSVLDGRQINVELSAGGGGKSEARIKKLKEKNAKLNKHRIRPTNVESKRDEKELPGDKEISGAKARHSETSGSGSKLTQKATWSVPRKGEKPSRGGQKHRSSRKTQNTNSKARQERRWSMTGANAIPVG
ncbi:hypothetical protein FRC17_010273 [Serendipita sp. 399]|nr:hypothetical protein FRC17_010273 [Serendipita sp. 399]